MFKILFNQRYYIKRNNLFNINKLLRYNNNDNNNIIKSNLQFNSNKDDNNNSNIKENDNKDEDYEDYGINTVFSLDGIEDHNNSTTATTETNDGELPKQPEVPTNCCGSGCGAACVWDIYYNQMEEYNKKLKILDPYAEEVPLDTSNNDEDPMQFFLKMERYNAMQQRKAELRAELEKNNNSNDNNNNNNNNK